MSKAVMLSIRPKWAEKIANGEKTLELRKTEPKLETPFKVYIYCTKGRDLLREVDCWNTKTKNHKTNYRIINLDFCTNKIVNGKVIGEFICDKVDNFYCASVPYLKENNLGYGQFIDNGVYKVSSWHEGIVFERNDRFMDSMLNNNDLKEMCLSAQEVFDYIGIGKHLCGLHISDLKIYDKPRELSEFKTPPCEKPEKACENCKYLVVINTPDMYEVDCFVKNGRRITRPPSSWQYVEELRNE